MANVEAEAAAAPGVLSMFYWVLIFGLVIGLLFLAMYCLFILSDLEEDNLNPYDAAAKLNKVAKSEFIVQVVLSALLVIGGCYIQVLLMLPMTVFTGHKICKKSTGGIEVLTSKLLEPAEIYDATEMWNVVKVTQQELFAKLAVYILSFFIVLYHSLLTLLTIILPLTKSSMMKQFMRPFSSATRKT